MDALITSMTEAARLVRDGEQVAYVGYMKMEPVAFFHELSRQGRRNLRLCSSQAPASSPT